MQEYGYVPNSVVSKAVDNFFDTASKAPSLVLAEILAKVLIANASTKREKVDLLNAVTEGLNKIG